MADEREELINDLETGEENIDFNEFYGEEPGKKPRNKKIFIILIPIVIILCVICVVAAIVVERMTPNKEYADLYQYYGVEEGSVSVIWDGELVTDAFVVDDNYYLNMDFVIENFNDKFYFDESLDSVLYTTLSDIYTIPFADTIYWKGDEQVACDYYAVVRSEDEIYIAMEFLKDKVSFTYSVLEEPERVVIVSDGTSITPVVFTEEALIRTGTSIKKEILANPNKETGYWYEVSEECKEGWMAVANMDGRRGYVKASEVIGNSDVYTYDSGFEPEVYKGNQRDHDIVMAWHPIYKVESNGDIANLLTTTEGINVISPTWYKVKNADGEIISMADKDYVDYVHSLGMEIWPLISDFTNVEGDGWSVKELLSNAESRRKLIENIIDEILILECEGVNIDFEYVREDNGRDYAQFIRELSIRCKEEGIVLSTDNPPPKAYNQYYNYKILGDCVDYVIIMGYDEYTKSSGEAGPVASIGYVKEGIEEALTMIPADKLINGIPFYTRLWSEYTDEDGNYQLDVVTCYMSNVWNKVAELGLTATWDEKLKLYEATGMVNGVYYSMWLEEETSMAAKIKLVRDNELAGISAWALGMEMSSIWDVILTTE